MSAEAVCLKQELEGIEAPLLTDPVLAKEEPEFQLEFEELCVKEEPSSELYADHVVKDELVLGPERPHRPTGNYAVQVLAKEEPEFQLEFEELCVKEEPSSELYADHVVKDELVLGPERPHRPTGNYVVQDESSFPALERVPSHGETASAGHETRTQAIDTNTLQGSADTSVYICDNCGHLYKQKHQLIRHIKQHLQHKSTTSGKDPKIDKKICKICDRKFKTLYGLKRHSSVHTGERPYSCEICKKKFKSREALKYHLRNHSPRNRERPYSCDICAKRFLQSTHLTSHIRRHTGDRPYSCEICKKKFTHSNNLRSHELTHTTVRPYRCDICGKEFKQLYYLKVHTRTHTDERPFSCETCKKNFKQKYTLKVHERIHTGEKPYACQICNKRFTQSEYLKSHIQGHNDERPYSCEICNKCFRTSRNLRSHKLTHVQRTYSCEVCEMKFAHRSNLKYHVWIHSKESFSS